MRLLPVAVIPLLFLFNDPASLKAQSMYSLFLRLPESCTPGLDLISREQLTTKGEYVVSEHLSHSRKSTLDYSIDTVTDNYLSYEYSSTKGQGSFALFEIKRFKLDDGKSILVFSKNADTKATANKFDLKIYKITDTVLVESKEHFLPEKIDYSAFIRSTAPDSVRSSIKKTSLCSFDLDMDAADKITSYIVLGSDDDKKWLSGNIMELKWTGKSFTGAVSFQKEKEQTEAFHSTWQAK